MIIGTHSNFSVSLLRAKTKKILQKKKNNIPNFKSSHPHHRELDFKPQDNIFKDFNDADDKSSVGKHNSLKFRNCITACFCSRFADYVRYARTLWLTPSVLFMQNILGHVLIGLLLVDTVTYRICFTLDPTEYYLFACMVVLFAEECREYLNAASTWNDRTLFYGDVVGLV